MFTVGGMFGSLSCIYLGDLLGRKKVIFFASIITIVGAILMTASFGLAQFIVARIILGLGTGGYIATLPVWQSEISVAAKRGAYVVTNGIFIGIGVALGLWVDFGFYFIKTSSLSWRFPLAFQIIMLASTVVFVAIFPESPRWLVKQGRVDEAREILSALADVDPKSESIGAEIDSISHSLSICGALSWKAMVSKSPQRLCHRTIIAATAQMFNSICGINLISMYALTIFQEYLGLDPIKSRILAACMCIMQPLGGCLAYYIIDRLGRRPLMIGSALAMCASMAILGGTTSVTNNTGALVVAVVFLFAFQFVYAGGFSGLAFLYATEVAPLQLRAAISAVSTAVFWVFNFMLAEVTPLGFNTLHYKYYIIFAAINAVIVPTAFFFFPETSGRSLEEIDEIFLQSKIIFDPPRIARRLPKMETTGGVGDESSDTADEKTRA